MIEMLPESMTWGAEKVVVMIKAIFGGLLVGVLSLTSLLAAPGQAADQAQAGVQNLMAKYVLRVGGIKIGKLSLSAAIDETSYNGNLSVKAEGLAGLFLKSTSDSTTSGRHLRRVLQPDHYQRIKYKRKGAKTVRVDYAGGMVDKVSFDPPRTRPLKNPVSEEMRRNTVDPVTALLQIIAPVSGTPCDRSFEVFDGKKRFDFIVKPLEAGTETTGPAPDGAENMIACRANFVRIAGFKPKHMEKPPQPPFDSWFSKVDGSPYWMAVRITTQSDFGTVIISNSKFQVGNGEAEKAEVQ